MTTFQHIRLELARDADHPHGDSANGYDLVAPLDGDGRLDLAACRAEPDRCRVRRFEACCGTRPVIAGFWIWNRATPTMSPASASARKNLCSANMCRC